jgi:tRNA threonylcarbamoyladenosine biosynthesis protein TsaE
LPVILALRGELGAGKSVLARAIARGAGVTSAMPSPTFNLLFSYQTALAEVLHFDLYRLESPNEVWELGWSELGDANQIVLIEWPERAEALLPPDRWDVSLTRTEQNPDVRSVRAQRMGSAPDLPEPE